MIVVPVLHPAFEVIIDLGDALDVGEVQRSVETVTDVGGKALNVVRLAARMGAPVRAIVLGDEALRAAVAADPIVGGPAVDLVAIPSPVPTRTDVALVDARHGLTVVNGTAAHPGAAALDAVLHATSAALRPGDVLVLAGSTPAGTERAYERLVREGRRAGATVIVDASGAWLVAAAGARPDVIKVNEAEARAIAPASGQLMAVTDGPRGLRWTTDASTWRRIAAPAVRVRCPLGAGDAVTAGLAVELARGGDAAAGLRLGTAMAAATLRHLAVTLEPDDVAALLPEVAVLPP